MILLDGAANVWVSVRDGASKWYWKGSGVSMMKPWNSNHDAMWAYQHEVSP